MNLFNLLATALSLQLQALRGGSRGGGGGALGPQCHRPQVLVERVVESVRTLVMQFDLRAKDECATQHFRGSMYGVTATVALELASREAHVELRGLPLGGRIAGIGWLKNIDGEAGEVELEEEFAAALAWRMISIQAASLDRHANTVTVHVTVPLLGAQQLSLKRANSS